jgi:hypothetical protein
MAITSAVVALETNTEFRHYVQLYFLSAADWVLSGNFPVNVTTDADKNKVTQFASDLYKGNVNLNSQVLSLLAQSAIQDKINSAEGVAGAYSIMQTQVRLNLRNISGCMPVYGTPEVPA